ncbi:hypothetical protein EDB85DRAFT_1889333 [Lactarius pseudohatsudake]|nr:hypothetical protein EDB85DRAFT_1889333 [Lactarius pseudohatsudake]
MFQSLAAHNFHTSVFRGAHSQFMTILGENVPALQPVVAHNATSLCSRYLASGRAARPHNTPTHIHYQDSPRSFMRQNCARMPQVTIDLFRKLLPASSEKPTRCPCGDETDDGRDSGEVGSRKYEWDPDVMRCDGCGTIAAARMSAILYWGQWNGYIRQRGTGLRLRVEGFQIFYKISRQVETSVSPADHVVWLLHEKFLEKSHDADAISRSGTYISATFN